MGITRKGKDERAMQAFFGLNAPVRLRVMIVDDHELVRNGIKALLAEEPSMTVAGEAGGVREAIERAEWARPDVVVMDIRLPDGSGIDATREIRARRMNQRQRSRQLAGDYPRAILGPRRRRRAPGRGWPPWFSSERLGMACEIRRGLRAARHLELGKDARHVVLDGLLRELKGCADLAVRFARCHLVENSLLLG